MMNQFRDCSSSYAVVRVLYFHIFAYFLGTALLTRNNFLPMLAMQQLMISAKIHADIYV